MNEQRDYKVQLEVFEGPLDLLLYLIKKEEVDIYNIPINTITTQYMEYLSLMRMLDLNIAGEFIVMAATLMMIKSRMLLPEEDRSEMDEEEEDPRLDLVRQLVEYKKFKEAAFRLQELELLEENVFDPGGDPLMFVDADLETSLGEVGLFDLISAFHSVLKKARSEEIKEIFGEEFTVADKIEQILSSLRALDRMRFSDLFDERSSKHEVVCTFLALLELIRLRQVSVFQERRFGEIEIASVEPTPVEPVLADV